MVGADRAPAGFGREPGDWHQDIAPPEDYETSGVGGYGEPDATTDRAPFYPASITSRMGEILPWLGR